MVGVKVHRGALAMRTVGGMVGNGSASGDWGGELGERSGRGGGGDDGVGREKREARRQITFRLVGEESGAAVIS